MNKEKGKIKNWNLTFAKMSLIFASHQISVNVSNVHVFTSRYSNIQIYSLFNYHK